MRGFFRHMTRPLDRGPWGWAPSLSDWVHAASVLCIVYASKHLRNKNAKHKILCLTKYSIDKRTMICSYDSRNAASALALCYRSLKINICTKAELCAAVYTRQCMRVNKYTGTESGPRGWFPKSFGSMCAGTVQGMFSPGHDWSTQTDRLVPTVTHAVTTQPYILLPV